MNKRLKLLYFFLQEEADSHYEWLDVSIRYYNCQLKLSGYRLVRAEQPRNTYIRFRYLRSGALRCSFRWTDPQTMALPGNTAHVVANFCAEILYKASTPDTLNPKRIHQLCYPTVEDNINQPKYIDEQYYASFSDAYFLLAVSHVYRIKRREDRFLLLTYLHGASLYYDFRSHPKENSRLENYVILSRMGYMNPLIGFLEYEDYIRSYRHPESHEFFSTYVSLSDACGVLEAAIRYAGPNKIAAKEAFYYCLQQLCSWCQFALDQGICEDDLNNQFSETILYAKHRLSHVHSLITNQTKITDNYENYLKCKNDMSPLRTYMEHRVPQFGMV